MKFLISSIALLLSTTSAFASGAVEYSCVGQDAVSGQSIVFEMASTDFVREVGYTNQSVTITKIGGLQLKKPIVFQSFETTKKNSCKKNSDGELYASDNGTVTPASNGLPGFDVTFKENCANAKFDVKGICLFQ